MTLTIRRGEETLDITITRAVSRFRSSIMRCWKATLPTLPCTLNEQATDQLRAALKELMAQNPKGLIFDLRNNGGGYLIAIEVSSEFIRRRHHVRGIWRWQP